MVILNLLWKYGLGGISKCFVSYAKMGDVAPDIQVVSVCIDDIEDKQKFQTLSDIGVRLIGRNDFWKLGWLRDLKHVVDEYKPDFIFCHGFNGPIIVRMLEIFFQVHIPMVCSFHSAYQAPTAIKKLIEPVYNTLYPYILKKHAQKVILVAKASSDFLIKKGVPQSKLTVVHNGIPETIHVAHGVELPEDTIKIGWLGRLDPIKGLEYLLDAIPVICNHTSAQFHVYLVGDGPLRESLSKKIHEMGIESQITLVGYQENISEWLNSWDIFCLPSLSECASIALLEAMRAGKAIVATDVGGNPELVTSEQHALLVPPMDFESLGLSLARLVNEEDLRKSLGNSARRRFISEFTETKMKEKIVSVFNSLKE